MTEHGPITRGQHYLGSVYFPNGPQDPWQNDPDRTTRKETPMTAYDAIAAAGGLHSTSDLADRWGITPQWARQLVRRDWFPAPILTAGGRELWLGDEADAAFIAHEERTVARSRRIGPRS